MVFSKFSNYQVTSLEAPWIKKPAGSSVLPGVNKLTVIFVLCVFVLYVFVLRINCFLLCSIRLLTIHVNARAGFILRGVHGTLGISQHLLAKCR